jgi:orotidine-5'-phosphate decarboxylase
VAEIIVALDQPGAAAALALADRLPGLRWAKVGATLFAHEGPAVIRALQQRHIRVFLDLKWHDIPHQVAGAARVAADLGVSLATVHALGGREMLAAARAAAGPMALVAVTVLTSHTAQALGEILGRDDLELRAEVLRLGQLAAGAGLAGVVSSPLEVADLRAALGPAAWIVVPGIRPAGSSPDDQRRTGAAAAAVGAGATHLVVGRPISGADEPAAVYQRLCEEAG